MEQLLLTHWRAPGDIVCMTAVVRDLVLTHPGRYEVHIAGSHPQLWDANPYVAGVWGPRPPGNMRQLRLSCRDAWRKSDNQQLHGITAMHRDLQRQLGVGVPTLYPQGDLHLSDAERSQRIVNGRYWLIVAGGKRDIPAKIWPAARFQAVVDCLRKEGVRWVQAGARLPGHWHPRLENVECYVGRTDLRGLLRLIEQAEGVLCPVSLPMHVAAAFDKPCVVIAGGREPWWWTAYINTPARHFGDHCAPVAVPHQVLHTIGQLDCCRTTGCWKTHVVRATSVREVDLCQQPVDDRAGPTPRCLHELTVEEVVSSVRSAIRKPSPTG